MPMPTGSGPAPEVIPSSLSGEIRSSGPPKLAPLSGRPAALLAEGGLNSLSSVKRLTPVPPLSSKPSPSEDPGTAAPAAAAPQPRASAVAPEAPREAANIADLKSPAAKGGVPPLLRDTLLITTSAQAGSVLPSLGLPGAVPGTPSGDPGAAASARNRETTAATAAVRGGAAEGAGNTTVRGKTPTPPPEDPPSHAIHDDRPLEEYIPFGFVELRERLLADHAKDVFEDKEVRRKFVELCKWISLRNALRLAVDYGDAYEKYSLLDPDKDTVTLKVAAAADAQATGAAAQGLAKAAECDPLIQCHSTSLLPNRDIKSLVSDVYKELDNILGKAEFQELPPEDLQKAKNDKSLMGLHVTPASDEFLESRVHYRGSRTKKIQWRHWGIFKRQIEMNVYERLAISFRLKKPVCEEDMPVDKDALGVDQAPWYKRWFCGRRVVGASALSELRDEFLYLKLFKDVLQCDVDMLLPGAVVKFTWLDHLLVWGPILFGLGFAIWKAVKGTIRFDNLKDAALSIILIVMPVTWGLRAYMAIKERQRLHQAHLNALFLLHNLNNNGGVISQLLNEAQEQEDNETMLAYFFLWKGSVKPAPVRKKDLDVAVEKYLQDKLDGIGARVRMDYEVSEAIVKLERMGLLQVIVGDDNEKQLQVLPLDEALAKAHVRHFNEATETGQPELPQAKSKRQGNLALAWHECMSIFRPTGQPFRFWWNAETGESTYLEPDEPYVKLGPGQALDVNDAHGVAVSDAAKQPTKV